jgi:rhodanese-related sulfurtransferase
MIDRMQHYKDKLSHETDSWDLFEALNRGDELIVVDTRSAEAFGTEHIPGAINLPHREMTEAATSSWDKSKLYITYCDGIGCNASTKGALRLSELRFRVKELIGGLDWWRRDGYATEGTKAQSGKAVERGC